MRRLSTVFLIALSSAGWAFPLTLVIAVATVSSPVVLLALVLVLATPVALWWGAGSYLSSHGLRASPDDVREARWRIVIAACAWVANDVFFGFRELTTMGRVMTGAWYMDRPGPRPDGSFGQVAMHVLVIACLALSWWASAAVETAFDDADERR